MTDAWERQMRAGHQVALPDRFGVRLLALRDGGLAVGVELDRDARLLELHRRDMYQVAPLDNSSE